MEWGIVEQEYVCIDVYGMVEWECGNENESMREWVSVEQEYLNGMWKMKY